MKQFLASERSRAGLLVVAAALIGGTGCVTAMVVGSVSSASQMAQAKLQRQQREEKLQLENAEIREAAERGDVAAMTRLGWFQVTGDRFGVPADPRGLALLEQAAAREYPPAQYLLGRTLVSGPRGIKPQAERGVELLMRAATRTCIVDAGRDSRENDYPARTLGELYLNGSEGIPADASKAELWMARNAAYCRDFRYGAFATKLVGGLSEYERRAKLEAWRQLAHGTDAARGISFTPEQAQMTARELRRLRQLVRDSESRYPALPQPAS